MNEPEDKPVSEQITGSDEVQVNEVPVNEEPMKKEKKSGQSWWKQPVKKKQIIYCSLLVVGVFFIAAALRVLLGDYMEDVAARSEYEQLRAYSPEAVQTPQNSESPDDYTEYDDDFESLDEENENIRALTFDELAAINIDFIGWINAGSHIDYPVVRGRDNEKYINTTFTGARNSAGAIFMDYRNLKGFDEHVSILYGHYTRDGTMFSSLAQYLNPSFLRNNPNIRITTRDGRTLNYRVFAARQTDAWDIAYTVGISDSARASEVFPDVPANASRFMLLSTCTRGGNDDERLLVFAALTG